MKEFATQIATPLGPMAARCSDQGLLVLGWTNEMPSTKEKQPILEDTERQVAAFFDGTLEEFTVPLTPNGTPFQQDVWQALQTIPYGKTWSYLDLALHLGDRNATRAVGGANGKNTIAVIIPCHRVIGSTGKMTGFGAGIERKRYLLELEGALPQMSLNF